MPLKLLVAGGLDPTADHTALRAFGEALGAGIAERGHTLVNMCQTELDKIVAEAAFKKLEELHVAAPHDRFITYVLDGRAPIHQCGRLLRSKLSNLQFDKAQMYRPETIDACDVAILAGGFAGTLMVANWARICHKPLLPITCFGGAAAQVFATEMQTFQDTYSARVDEPEYSVLNQITTDWPKLAGEVLALAEKIVTSRFVLVIMSYDTDDQALKDAYSTFLDLGAAIGYTCLRIDGSNNVNRIIPALLKQISDCAFVIVDLSEPRPNVYYELGYADALRKPLIVTAKKGTPLPFDVYDIPTIFWENQTCLREEAMQRMKQILRLQGRG